MNDLTITFPGGSRVNAEFAGFTVSTDQPPAATAPTPFELFLASIGTCAGVYVLGFLTQRMLPTDGLAIDQHIEHGPTGLVTRITLDVRLPEGVPEKYRAAIIRSAEHCAVKKHLELPPEIAIGIGRALIAN